MQDPLIVLIEGLLYNTVYTCNFHTWSHKERKNTPYAPITVYFVLALPGQCM